MTDALITSIVSGGGCVALALAVLLHQRDQTRELRAMNRSLGRILQAVGIVEDDSGDTVQPATHQIAPRRRGTPIRGVSTEYVQVRGRTQRED